MADEIKSITSSKVKFGKDAATPIQLVTNEGNFVKTGNVWHEAASVMGDNTKVLEGDNLLSALSKAADAAKKGTELEPHEFNQLVELAESDGMRFRGVENPYQFIVDAKKFREAYKDSNKEALGKLLVAEEEAGEHLKLVPQQEVATFRRGLETAKEGAYAEFAADVKHGQNFRKEIAKVNFQDTKFDKPGEAEKYLDGVIAKFYDKKRGLDSLQYVNGEVDRHLAKGTGYFSMPDAIDKFKGKVESSQNAMTVISEKITKIDEAMKKATSLFGSPKEQAVLKEERQELAKEYDKLINKNPAHAVGYNHLPDHIRTKLDSLSSSGSKAVSGIGSVVTDTAEKTKGKGLFEVGGLFGRSEETVAKIAKAEGKEIADIGKISRTKVGLTLAGIAAVGTAVVAATGGTAERSRAVAANQNAQGQGAAVGA